MDITHTLASNSDQLDAIDLIGGPQTFRIAGVEVGPSKEQPINVRLDGFPRVWRPPLTMRRILVRAWGSDAAKYVGRSVTLYLDPDVRFGKDKPGGTRISHLSHIDRPLTTSLPVSRGKSAIFTVEPLVEAAPAPTNPTNPTNPNGDLLAEIGALADRLPGGRKGVAADWADSHGGESLRDATDLGGLELLRDDLANLPELAS